ncbi:MAG: hypothetical protein HDR51_07255 [Treponema sp.]|nr:hypothetical protein [Treponema sp.]MDE6245442.1 hypothetical protein [Treponemataceae bacterium]
MKIAKIMMATAVAVLLAGCSSPKIRKPQTLHAEFTDWQGAAYGAEIPKWVSAVMSAESEDEIRKLFDKPDGYRIWAAINRGSDLDALRLDTDNSCLTQVRMSIFQNALEGVASIADLSSNGIERVASYWTKYFMADKKRKPVNGDAGKERYSYVVVMGMEGDRFNALLDAAMAKIRDDDL